jgi:hypothetical protein
MVGAMAGTMAGTMVGGMGAMDGPLPIGPIGAMKGIAEPTNPPPDQGEPIDRGDPVDRGVPVDRGERFIDSIAAKTASCTSAGAPRAAEMAALSWTYAMGGRVGMLWGLWGWGGGVGMSLLKASWMHMLLQTDITRQ